MAENAQQDPHCPWSLIGETFPKADQSTSPRFSFISWSTMASYDSSGTIISDKNSETNSYCE